MPSLWPDIIDALDGVQRQRVAWLTFGGTWGVPGTGYCSWVVQACDEGLVYEIPVPGPYTFGPIPAIGSPRIDSPSYRQSVAIAVDNGVGIVNTLPPKQLWGAGGYSMGGECASRLAEELQPGGRLAHRADTFVGGFTFGNPCRMSGVGIGPGGPPVSGHGISTHRMTILPTGWVDYVNVHNGVPDIYAASPDGQVGDIMGDAYELGVDIQLNDLIGFTTTFVKHVLKLVSDAGVGLPPDLFGLGLGAFMGLVKSLIPKLNTDIGNPKTAAAAQAGVLALRFLASQPPTAPHVTYEFDEAAPAVTFLQHAVSHVTQTSRTAIINGAIAA